MKSFFVTGTDTDVGKTVFTCTLAHLMCSLGLNVGVMKPFATGEPQEGPKSHDVALLAKYSKSNDAESLLNPYFFEIPASPYMAAKKLGKSIDIDVVLSSFEKLQAIHDVVLVEGIGGIMTPILKDYFVADLIKDMNLDTIIVAGTKIGTVNHTLLTLESCKKYGIRTAGLVINNTVDGYDMQDLENDLVALSGIDILCKIPHVANGNPELAAKYLGQNFLNVLTRL